MLAKLSSFCPSMDRTASNLLTAYRSDRLIPSLTEKEHMIQGPVYEMVQSVKQLVVDVLEEASTTLAQATITDKCTLVEVGSTFGMLADSIIGLGTALS